MAESVGRSTFVNSLGMRFIRIPAGTFQMHTPPPLIEVPYQSRSFKATQDAREARIEKDFFLAELLVTNAQYRRFAAETGHPVPKGEMLDVDRVRRGLIQIWDHPDFNGDDHPVVGVIHVDAAAFCTWLSEREGRTYRLPTVAEWEYACRAATATPFYWGDHADPRRCNYQGSRINRTVPVGSYEPNPWGLYDMIGNAAELTGTLWGHQGRYYIKGGSWCHPWWWLDAGSYMASYSDPLEIAEYSATVGFRLCCDADPSSPRTGDLDSPVIIPAGTGPRIPKLGIVLGKPIDIGKAPTNEAALLTCWDPAQGPDADRRIWIVWDKRSTDAGKTWEKCNPVPHTALQLVDGTVLAVGGADVPSPDETGRFILSVSKDAWKTVDKVEAKIELPQAQIRSGRMLVSFHQGLLEMPDGTLLMSAYGHFEGDMEHEDYCAGYSIEGHCSKTRAILLESADRGGTWTLRATIANYPGLSREGCDEPDIALLPSGELFCAMRTGISGYGDDTHRFDEPIYVAFSRSQGRHWGDIEKVFVGDKMITGIFPRIVVLDNGVVAFLRSRPGSSVVFNPDGTGTAWTDEMLLETQRRKMGPPAGTMNALRKIAPHTLLAVYLDTRWHYILQPITVTKQT